MFDFDMSKMAVIGTVALVVIGPERLPRVARTLGTLLGRAQRYLQGVQAEVAEQIKIEDLRKMKDGIEQEVLNMHTMVDRTVRQQAGQWQAGVDAAVDSVKEALPGNYLSSAHEAGIDLQAELFKVRPAAPAAFGGQPIRVKRHAALAGGRRGMSKRCRVVSMAASKSLGR